MSRRALMLALLLAGCASSAPPAFPPLRYTYLTPLDLNVATIDVVDSWQQLSAADIGGQSPVNPAAALAQMGRDRLKPAGNAGRAVFNVIDASMIENGNAVNGQLAVELDIMDAGGVRVGFAEARVVRTQPDVASGARRAGQLYDFVHQMMDAMNVEFEYQVRKNLSAWLVSQPAPGIPGPVTQQPLPPPGP